MAILVTKNRVYNPEKTSGLDVLHLPNSEDKLGTYGIIGYINPDKRVVFEERGYVMDFYRIREDGNGRMFIEPQLLEKTLDREPGKGKRIVARAMINGDGKFAPFCTPKAFHVSDEIIEVKN